MYRLFLILLLALTVIFACMADDSKSPDLKEGDIVFQISKSQQSPLIIAATDSPWSHCGIIIEKDHKLYVLEASNTVKIIPFEEWKRRGKLGKFIKRRIYDQPIKIDYKQYLKIPYDIQFKLNNGRYYCSELIWEIYKNQFDTILVKPHPIADYDLNKLEIKNAMRKRNIKENQLIIASVDLINP